MDLKRTNYSSGAPMEEIDGYSRIVQTGPFVFVGGTTSVQPDGSMVAEGDSYGQVKYVLEKLLKLVAQTGATKEDVYSVKIYATPDFESTPGFQAYSEIFKEVSPLLTVVTIHKLTRPTQLVEIEMSAIVGCSTGATWEGIKLERTNYASGSPLEAKLGYSRMVKVGPFIYVGGTTSVQPDGSVAGEGSAVEQNDYILEKEIDLLAQAGAAPEDIVKIKKYVTTDYAKTWDAAKSTVKLPYEAIVYSQAVVDKLTRPAQLVETEMMAVVSCGHAARQESIGSLEEAVDALQMKSDIWGKVDFTKKAVGDHGLGYAAAVQVGPFVYASLVHSIDENGTVVGICDSEIQESYTVEKLTNTLAELDVEPKEVVKLKGYYTEQFGPLYGETETPYYEKTYKPIKPLYTGVYVSTVGGEDEIFTVEMTAVRGC